MTPDRRQIGSLEVSLPGLGGNNFGRRLDALGTREVVEAALEAGVTHFDTADIYGGGASETLLGEALAERRDEVVIATKFAMGQLPDGLSGGDPRWVMRACEQSLRRLSTETIDLYLLHRPDPTVPIGETLAALNRLIEQGKVREIGCSNFSVEQLMEAHQVARERGLRGFACVQNEYNLLAVEPQRSVIAACEAPGLAFVPYFPLAMGLLSGKYRRGRPLPAGTRLTGTTDPEDRAFVEERLTVVERLADYAERHGHTLLELALGWLASQDRVASVIAGAMTAGQVRGNVAAVNSWRLTPGEMAEVEQLRVELGEAG
jgi:aryl-alcohol dehydrogenase-like predicted oxidoreductase